MACFCAVAITSQEPTNVVKTMDDTDPAIESSKMVTSFLKCTCLLSLSLSLSLSSSSSSVFFSPNAKFDV